MTKSRFILGLFLTLKYFVTACMKADFYSLLCIFKQGSTITLCGLREVYGMEILFIYSYYCWGVGNFISRHLKNQWHALWGLLKDWCCEIDLVIKRDCTLSSHCVHQVGFCVADDFEKMAYSFLSHAWEQKRIHDPNPLILHTKLAGMFSLVEIVIRTTKWRQHLRE